MRYNPDRHEPAVQKACACCREIKPASAFFRAPLYADKLTPRCRQCIKLSADAMQADLDRKAAVAAEKKAAAKAAKKAARDKAKKPATPRKKNPKAPAKPTAPEGKSKAPAKRQPSKKKPAGDKTSNSPRKQRASSEALPDGARRCIHCGEIKPIETFAMSRGRPLGHCKACEAARYRARYHRDIEASRAANRERRRANPELDRERHRRHRMNRSEEARDRERIAVRKRLKAYRGRHPDRAKARAAVRDALRDGRIKRATECQIVGCIATARLELHHEDYRRPLDVVTVCRRHHEHLHHSGPLPLKNGEIVTAPEHQKPSRQPQPQEFSHHV